MNHPMIAMLGGPEIVVILLLLLMVAGLAVGLVLLAIWLAQRQGLGKSDARESRPIRKLSFVEVSNGKPRLRWGLYLLGLCLVLVGSLLLNGLLLAVGVWSGVDTVLIGLVVGVVIFNILVFLEFNYTSGTNAPGNSALPAGQPSPAPAPDPTPAPAARSSCPRCGAPFSPSAPQGLCPKCVLGVGLATQTEADPDEHGPHGTKIVPPAEAEVARRFPQLEILECLGHGGMGVVYKARQPKLNRLVALKILAPEKAAEPKFAERFEREAQALARLNHPNIVAVHDYGEADGMFYLLMEYVDGSTLRQLLRAGRLKPESALAIVPSICEALQFAHQQGVVHRDIKPENVLLDLSGRVKIADFGIAKLVDLNAPRPALTEERSVIGTPHYMAPEQVEHPQLVDHRADIYSLGVVFYEMLTGELPLGKFQPPSRKVELDVRFDEVVLHALEKEPARRYQHASEVKTDVDTIRTSATPIRRPDNGGRCRIPGTDFALVISRAGQRQVEWNHVALAGLLLILAGACGLGMVALVAQLSGFNIEPRSYQAAGVGLAFVAAMLLTIVVRRALLMTEEEFARPDPRAITVVNETTDPAHIEMARRRVQWPATGLLAIGLCFPMVLGCFFYFGYWPGNWQGAFALGCALTLGYTIILGSHRMRQLKTYRVAVLGAVTGLLVTFPALPLAAFPIWALMVLHRPDVRAAFNDPHRPGTTLSQPLGEWLKMLAIIAAIVFLVVALPPTVTWLSLTVLNRMKDSPTSPALVVAAEEKLRSEILHRVSESGWKPESLSVSVSPDLRRAECHLGRLWKNGLTQEPPWRAAVRITRQRPGLWLVQGEGEFHALRFSVDTTPEPASIPDPSRDPARSLEVYANEVWRELPPKLKSVRTEDAPGIAAETASAIAQRILWPRRDAVQQHILEELRAGEPLDQSQWTSTFSITQFNARLVDEALPPGLVMFWHPVFVADAFRSRMVRERFGQEGVLRWKVLEGVVPLPNLLIRSDPETPVIATPCGNRLIVVSLERGLDGLYRCRRVEVFERNAEATQDYWILPEHASAGQRLVHDFTRAVWDRLLSRLDSVSLDSVERETRDMAEEIVAPRSDVLRDDARRRLESLPNGGPIDRSEWRARFPHQDEAQSLAEVRAASNLSGLGHLPIRWDPVRTADRVRMAADLRLESPEALGRRALIQAVAMIPSPIVTDANPEHPEIVTRTGNEMTVVRLRRDSIGRYEVAHFEWLVRRSSVGGVE